ncbi:MAG TPA: hypothetical protein VGE02_12650 [Gemmatimonadales bacterium]
MHVQYVALCDQVVIGADGRPTLVGVLSDLQAPQLPVTLPRLGLAARIHFTSDETDRQVRVEVLMTDPNGVEIGRPGGEVTLPRAPHGLDSVAVDIPLHFDMFEISTAGRYTFLLHVDGKPQSAAQLNVRIAQNPQLAQSAPGTPVS